MGRFSGLATLQGAKISRGLSTFPEDATGKSRRPTDGSHSVRCRSVRLQNEGLQQGAAILRQALLSQDPHLQSESHYNLGNTLYQRGEAEKSEVKKLSNWESALPHYEETLKAEPQNKNAKDNYEFVKKKIEELKKKQEQKPTPPPSPSPSPSPSPQKDQKNDQKQDDKNQQQNKDQQQKDQQQKDQQQQSQNGQGSEADQKSDNSKQSPTPTPTATSSPTPSPAPSASPSPTPGETGAGESPTSTPEPSPSEGEGQEASPPPAAKGLPRKPRDPAIKMAAKTANNRPRHQPALRANR